MLPGPCMVDTNLQGLRILNPQGHFKTNSFETPVHYHFSGIADRPVT